MAMLQQMKKVGECFKGLVDKHGKKKVLENLSIAVLAGIAIMIAASSFSNGKNQADFKPADSPANTASSIKSDEDQRAIESILSHVKGAGRVKVVITYVSGNEIVPATESKKDENATQEKDTTGGERNTKQNNSESSIAYEEAQSGVKKPVILKELKPKAQGVVVVADGADNPAVRSGISAAVQALTDVPVHKIQILKMK